MFVLTQSIMISERRTEEPRRSPSKFRRDSFHLFIRLLSRNARTQTATIIVKGSAGKKKKTKFREEIAPWVVAILLLQTFSASRLEARRRLRPSDGWRSRNRTCWFLMVYILFPLCFLGRECLLCNSWLLLDNKQCQRGSLWGTMTVLI